MPKVTGAHGHNPVDRMTHPRYAPVMSHANDILDARGLLCPLPVLKVRKRLKSVPTGGVLELWADDPAAIVDVPHFCHEAGVDLVSQSDMDGHQVYLIRKP